MDRVEYIAFTSTSTLVQTASWIFIERDTSVEHVTADKNTTDNQRRETSIRRVVACPSVPAFQSHMFRRPITNLSPGGGDRSKAV